MPYFSQAIKIFKTRSSLLASLKVNGHFSFGRTIICHKLSERWFDNKLSKALDFIWIIFYLTEFSNKKCHFVFRERESLRRGREEGERESQAGSMLSWDHDPSQNQCWMLNWTMWVPQQIPLLNVRKKITATDWMESNREGDSEGVMEGHLRPLGIEKMLLEKNILSILSRFWGQWRRTRLSQQRTRKCLYSHSHVEERRLQIFLCVLHLTLTTVFLLDLSSTHLVFQDGTGWVVEVAWISTVVFLICF